MILCLKTADQTAQIWLMTDDRAPDPERPNVSWESGRQLSNELLDRLVQLVESSSHQLSDITGLVIFSGPGSFTSLRIGHTVLNALADSLSIPVVGAQGDSWLADGIEAVAKAKPGQPALPEYGAEAHITRPKA